MKDNKETILLIIVIVLAAWNIFNTNSIKTDVKSYKEKIENIQIEVDSVQVVNKKIEDKVFEVKENVNNITKEIHHIDNNLTIVKEKTNEKINNVNNFVILPTKTARLIYKDLLKFDGCKEEVKLLNDKIFKLNEKDSQKDTIINLLTTKDKNNQFMIVKKDEQLKVSEELTNSLHKELKSQRTKTFLWKVGTFAGILASTYLIITK